MLNKIFILLFISYTSLQATELEIAGKTPKPGVYVNSDGAPIIPLIKSTKKSLDIEIYTMNDPGVHAAILDALKRGVAVRIVIEPNPVGTRCSLFSREIETDTTDADCVALKKLAAEVRSNGGEFVAFKKSELCSKNCYQHGKIALADNKTALISTGNFDSSNLCSQQAARCNRDYSLVLNDELVVNTLNALFEADLKGDSYKVGSFIPEELKDQLTVSPNSLIPLLNYVDSAKTSIELEAQYLKVPEFNQALIRAAKRGVQVSLTVSSFCAFGKPKVNETKTVKETYAAFDEAGISTKIFSSANLINEKPGYMHAKAIVIDGERAWIGSENGSEESFNHNREYGLIIDIPAWVKTVQQTTSADHTSAESESWKDSLTCMKDREVLIQELGE